MVPCCGVPTLLSLRNGDGARMRTRVWLRACRLLRDLEPGVIRSMWKASMARYVLDDARALELLASVSVWDDFPSQPGQVRARPCDP